MSGLHRRGPDQVEAERFTESAGQDTETLAFRRTVHKHISAVRLYLAIMIGELWDRSNAHDKTKLEQAELPIFAKHCGELKTATYGSPAYAKALEKVQVALQHHYAHNRHHPEHHPNGIDSVTLIDLMEMLADWMAASNRAEGYNPNGNILSSIEHNTKRFGISDQLVQILQNTARWMQAQRKNPDAGPPPGG